MGPSGSGKSTLMHLLAGLDRPTGGEVWIDGTQIGALGDTELTKLRRRHIGFVFQFFNLLPMLTAEENVLLPLRLAGRSPEPAWVEELIGRLGLGDRRTHRPSELSGGQQQRVALARALVTKPTVVFADEPTGNLDSTTSREILALLRDSVSSYGQTTVMVTHDPTAAAIADRIVFLADGQRRPGARPLERARCARGDGGGERPMIRVTFKGLAGRRLRAALTALAIVLGVAMVSGTFAFTDRIEKAVDTLFTGAYTGADAVVSGKEVVESVGGRRPDRARRAASRPSRRCPTSTPFRAGSSTPPGSWTAPADRSRHRTPPWA